MVWGLVKTSHHSPSLQVGGRRGDEERGEREHGSEEAGREIHTTRRKQALTGDRGVCDQPGNQEEEDNNPVNTNTVASAATGSTTMGEREGSHSRAAGGQAVGSSG